jgi:protein SCO1/2
MSVSNFSLYVTSAVLVVLLAAQPAVAAKTKLPAQLKGVTIAERLGQKVPLETPFVDHNGKSVQLKDYFKGDLPVILTLNYYRCKTLCSLQLNAVVAGLQELGWKVGEKFRIVTISIDPKEGSKLARDKRASYLRVLDQGPDVPWAFLVGKKFNIDRVAKAVGFKYRYLPKEKQYAHAAAIYMLSPKGKISRYLYGVRYPGRQLKFALVDASEGKVGSTIDRILLSCFHYDPKDGQYTPFAFGMMRVGAVITMILLGSFLLFFWRREAKRRKRQRAEAVDANEATQSA